MVFVQSFPAKKAYLYLLLFYFPIMQLSLCLSITYNFRKPA